MVDTICDVTYDIEPVLSENRGENRMTINELMKQVDVDQVTEAFMLVNWIFKSDDYEFNIVEKFKAITKIRDVIRENITLFRECVPSKKQMDLLCSSVKI